MYWGYVFWLRRYPLNHGKIQPGVIPGCPVSCITVVTVIQWYFPSLMGETEPLLFIENKSSLRQAVLCTQCAATMIYYEVLKRMTSRCDNLITQLY